MFLEVLNQHLRSLQHLLCHRVVDTIVAVLDVLFGERIVWIAGLLVAVGTLLTPLAFSLHPEAADVGPVAFVVGRVAGQLGQQLGLVAGELAQPAARPHSVSRLQRGVNILIIQKLINCCRQAMRTSIEGVFSLLMSYAV